MIFRLIRRSGKFIQQSKRVKLDIFKRWFGINETNKVVGWTPDYVGSIPSKAVNAFNFIAKALIERIKDIKSSVSSDCYNELIKSANEPRVVFSAGYNSVHPHLREYLKDNTTEGEWSMDNIMRILMMNKLRWFVAPVCSFYDVSELFTLVKTKLDAFPGHYTNLLYGPKKAQSDFDSRVVASQLWGQLKLKPLKNMYLWSILGREKDIKVDVNNSETTEVGTRVVLTTENPMCTLLMWFAQKMSYVLNANESVKRTFSVLGEFDATKARKLTEKAKDFDWKLEADWTYYDSNIDTNFLLVAGILLTSGLPDDRLHRNIAYLIIKSVVTKYVAMPPGVVIELNRAQPSGHPFGTLINCYVNTIYWSLIGFKIYGPDYGSNMSIEVYGDDTYALFKNHPNLVNIDKYVKECGLKSEPLLNNFVPTSIRTSKSGDIDFLKRRFDENGIRWNHKKMFDKWLYQSRNRDINEQISLVNSYITTAPEDDDARTSAKIIFKYLIDNFKERISTETRLIIEPLLLDKYTVDNRYKYYNFTTDIEFNYKKYIDVYKWSVLRCREDEFFTKIVDKYTTDGQRVLMALGYNTSQIFSYSQKWELFGGLSPPEISGKSVSAIINDYWSNLIRGSPNYLLRRLKALSYCNSF